MPRLHAAERALALLASSPSQQYICRACRQQATRRALHTTPAALAEESFLSRIRNSVFGSQESKEAEQRRSEARKQRVEALSQQSEDERQGGVYVDHQGREWDVAALVDESLNKDYTPATTWDGLDRIGSDEWVRQRADAGEVYYGFAHPKKLELTDDQWKRLLHHVAVEVMALQQAGRDLDQVCYERPEGNGYRTTPNIRIAMDGDKVVLTPTHDAGVERVLEYIPTTAQEARERTSEVLRNEAEGVTKGTTTAQEGDDWMQLPLANPVIKLTILKRVTQLSGHRSRDSVISSARTLADLYNAFKTKEKPKKLSQSEKMQALREDNPNVVVHASRRTPIHKHTEVGRWKLITDELEQRNLPVTGSRWRDAKTTAGIMEKGKKRQRRKKSVI